MQLIVKLEVAIKTMLFRINKCGMFFLAANTDADSAISLNSTNPKAYLKKGWVMQNTTCNFGTNACVGSNTMMFLECQIV